MTIFQMAMEDNVAGINQHLTDINIVCEDSKSLLHYAVLGSAHNVIDYLLVKGIDINLKDKNAETAIFDCARKAKVLIAKKLILKHANINVVNKMKESLLHLACSKGNLEIIELLMDAKIKVDMITKDGKLPIHYAILAGNYNIVDQLLKTFSLSKFMADQNNNTLLHYAAMTSSCKMIELFINHKLDPNALNNQLETPLFMAAKSGTYDTNLLLLNHNALLELRNIRFDNVFNIANFNENYAVLNLYAEYQTRTKYINFVKNNPYVVAILNNDILQVKNLLLNKVEVDNPYLGLSPLDYAKKYQRSEIVQLLLASR